MQVRSFKAWLAQRTENVIVVVSHHNFLQGLLGTTDHVQNCTPILCEVASDGSVSMLV
jgi:hypothetical protein